MVYSLNFSRQGNFIVASSDTGTIHCFALPQKDEAAEEGNSFEEEGDGFSDLSVAKNDDKECRVCSVTSWIQALLPIDYKELATSKKSDYKLTNQDFNSPNVCCMDREENNIIMFMKKKEFKMFTLEGGKLFQDTEFEAEF
eukprot:CAMPEP_0168331800 /NCGR_PEP_ID=MMETSP0213-20121227/8552_1 /TAXON_ID=151035 /ORGANISM="Euplotes harpa, Strain FSP1.4" /LENGTH=140 /DNA_ID=CAMNT_0008335651 /DNA_START=656 /DNA_END=1078 /DNA_ORIENTATION=+